MRKLLTGIAVFALILMQVQGVFGLTSLNTVNAREEQVVLDNDLARVSVTSEVAEDAIEWTLRYEKRAPEDATQRAIRVRLAQAEDGTGTVQRKEGDLKQAENDDWFREAEFTAASDGELTVTTPLDAKQLAVWVQLDSQLMGQETADLLTGTDAAAKIVAAPELPTTETTEKEEATEPEKEIVVDETPVDVAKPELQEEAAPVKEVEAKQEEKKAVEARLAYSAPILLERAGSANPNDQFTYTEAPDGTYPRESTQAHLPNGTDSDIRNYNYADSSLTTTDTKVESILNSGSAFAKGYTTYSGGSGADEYNVYTKKSVMPTDKANQFQVQLDVIGDAIESLPKLDVVLVVDKSGSMEGTKWSQLQTAVKSFSDSLLDNDKDVQLGLVTYGGKQTGNNWGTYAQIASFGDIATGQDAKDPEFAGFTTTSSSLTGHASMTSTPTGGTPTFLGFDAGLHLLFNKKMGARDDVAKVIITITDGEPTYRPTDNYSYSSGTTQRTVRDSLNQAAVSQVDASFRYTPGTSLWAGNGSTSEATQTVNHIERRFLIVDYADMHSYSIGFGKNSASENTLNALGKHGAYEAANAKELAAALNDIQSKYTAQIYQATLTDPMSDAVEYLGDLRKTALLLKKDGTLVPTESTAGNFPPYASAIGVSVEDDNKIVLKDVTLSASAAGQEGFRITYMVELKNDYRDGKFYQTNGTTSLKNYDNNYLHFAIPSVRDVPAKGSLTVKKNWEDQNDDFNTREEIVMQLYSRKQGQG